MGEQETKLIHNLYRFEKKQRLWNVLGNWVFFLIIILLLWLSVSLADHLFYFSTLTRWGLWVIHSIILILLVVKFIVLPVRKLFNLSAETDLSSASRQIGHFFPELSDMVENCYALITKKQNEAVSTGLLSAAINRYLQRLLGHDFEKRINYKNYLPSAKIAFPVLISAFILLGFKFDNVIHSTKRILNPTKEYIQLAPFQFAVNPGNTRIIKGQSLPLEVQYEGPALRAAFINIWTLENKKDWQSIEMVNQNGIFKATVNDIREAFNYNIQGLPLYDKQLNNQLWSDNYTVQVLTPPLVNTLDITLIPPAYSGLKEQYLERNIGDIIALPGTKVKLKGGINKDIESAHLKFASGSLLTMNIQGRRISAEFDIRDNDRYLIELIDTDSLRNPSPIEYSISTLYDNPPFIEISRPGQDIESTLDATIALSIEARDDYGFSEVSLYFKYLRSASSASDTNWQRIPLVKQTSRSKQLELTHLWDFNKMPLAFDDGLVYYAQARDNNRINGPGVGISNTYYIRFPSLEEIFDAFNEQEADQIEKVEDIVKQSDDLKKTLEEISRDLRRSEEIDWAEKQQIEGSLEKQKQLQEQIKEIQENLQELIDQLDAANLISEEVLEKYMQLQELFNEIASPELLEAMNRLQQSLEKADPQEVRQALQDFKLNQEAFQERIERTMELLKQIQLEQRMDQLVQKANSLLEQQQKITEQLESNENLGQEQFESLQNQQNMQDNKLSNLERDLEQFLNEPRLSRFQETLESLNSASDALKDPQLEQDAQSLKENLKSGQQNLSAQKSQSLQNQFAQISQMMSNAQNQMLQQNKKDIERQMTHAMQRLLELSHMQEGIQGRTRGTSTLSEQFNDLIIAQNRAAQNLQRVISDLIQLSKETFFIQPGLSQSLGKTQSGMAKSLNELTERNSTQAMNNQGQALGGLNESIMMMRQSLSQMQQSQSGTGLEQFMEQLQQMAGAQGQLNQETLNLFQGQGNSGQLTLQQQSETRRLAAQQAALREAMQEMSEQMGSRQDVLGRIGELAGKMDEVVEDLLKQNVNRETINRQREILSRMLDAQKSVREREHSKQRKAELAREYQIIDPGALKNLTDAEKKKLLDALKRSVNEGYQSDYQKLIEAYFNQLLRQKTEKN